MGMTEQEPARDGSPGSGRAEGQEAGHGTPFGEFLEWEAVRARARNDTAWLEGYENWLKNMPEDGGREDYIARSKVDYEKRMGETVDECMDRMHKDMLAKLAEYRDEDIKEDLDELARRHIKEATDRQIMVDNFKTFQREYIDMTVRRSC